MQRLNIREIKKMRFEPANDELKQVHTLSAVKPRQESVLKSVNLLHMMNLKGTVNRHLVLITDHPNGSGYRVFQIPLADSRERSPPDQRLTPTIKTVAIGSTIIPDCPTDGKVHAYLGNGETFDWKNEHSYFWSSAVEKRIPPIRFSKRQAHAIAAVVLGAAKALNLGKVVIHFTKRAKAEELPLKKKSSGQFHRLR